MSSQIDEVTRESPSPAGEHRKRKKAADNPIVPLARAPLVAPPSDLAQFLDDPPLVGNEKREDYDRFFLVIAAAVNPADPIAWLFAWDIAYLSWEIRRERIIKADIIKSAQIDAVRSSLEVIDGKLTSLFDSGKNEREARQWASNAKSRRETDKKLSDNGYGQSDILAGAYILGARNIDAVDRRMASYETRRMAVLRELEYRNERFARKLEAASARIIDAEVIEASRESS